MKPFLGMIAVFVLAALGKRMYLWAKTHPVTRKVLDHPLVALIMSNPVLRAELGIHAGLVFNLAYASVQFIYGILTHSLWIGTLSAFHMLLAVMRFLLLKRRNRCPIGQDIVSELRQYRLCGMVLLFLVPIFASVFVLTVHGNYGAKYPSFLIYFFAVYAICSAVIAVRSVKKFKKYGSPLLSAAKIVSLTAALMSVLSLETAVLARFDNGESPILRQALMGTACGAVCVLVFGMAVFMIVRGTAQLKKQPRKKVELINWHYHTEDNAI